MIYETIHVTIPNFNENKIEDYYLTSLEIQTINSLTIWLHCSGEWENLTRAIRIYERLIKKNKKP